MHYNSLTKTYLWGTFKIGLWIALGFAVVIIAIPLLIWTIHCIVDEIRFTRDTKKWRQNYQSFKDNILDFDLTSIDKAFAFKIADYIDCINVLNKAKDIKNPTKDDLEVISIARDNLETAEEYLRYSYGKWDGYNPEPREHNYHTFNEADISVDTCATHVGATMVLSLFALAVCFVTGLCRLSTAGNSLKSIECEAEYIQDIYCMDLQNEVKGNRIMVTTDSYYYYYIKNEDGYKLSKIQVEGTAIRETENTPSLCKYKKAGESKVRYVLYVPVGTVIEAGYDVF